VENSARKDAFEVLIEAMVRTSQFKLAEKVDPILAKKYKVSGMIILISALWCIIHESLYIQLLIV